MVPAGGPAALVARGHNVYSPVKYQLSRPRRDVLGRLQNGQNVPDGCHGLPTASGGMGHRLQLFLDKHVTTGCNGRREASAPKGLIACRLTEDRGISGDFSQLSCHPRGWGRPGSRASLLSCVPLWFHAGRNAGGHFHHAGDDGHGGRRVCHGERERAEPPRRHRSGRPVAARAQCPTARPRRGHLPYPALDQAGVERRILRNRRGIALRLLP